MLVTGASPAVRCRFARTGWPSRSECETDRLALPPLICPNKKKFPTRLQEKVSINGSLMEFAVATPKQIREVMQVDGLTNDEVKSHLQVRARFNFV